MPRAIEDVLTIVKNTYEHGGAGDNNVDGSSLIEDFGTETQPILSVNATNHKFGIPKSILQNNSQIQVYGNGVHGGHESAHNHGG